MLGGGVVDAEILSMGPGSPSEVQHGIELALRLCGSYPSSSSRLGGYSLEFDLGSIIGYVLIVSGLYFHCSKSLLQSSHPQHTSGRLQCQQ